MPVYSYKAYSVAGQMKTGIADADSPREARLKLRRDGLLVTDIVEVETNQGKEMSAFRKRRMRKQTGGELPAVTRQLATLMRAGIPLNDALKALIEQIASPRLETVFRNVRERINQGAAFADAIEQHPGVFPPLYVSMVRAGEAAGNTDIVLQSLAEFLMKQAKLKNKVGNALMYPVILLAVVVLIVGFLMTMVVPKLIELVESQGGVLPTPTLLLKAISGFFVEYWYLLLLGIIVFNMALGAMRRTERGRLRFDRFLLKLPLAGDLIAKQAISRFAVTLSTLLKSGVPVLEAIKIVREIVGNAVIEVALDDLHKAILEGADIATPLKRSGIFPPAVGYMIAVGEQSGELEEVLDRLSENYEDEITIATERLTTAMEPILTLVMAAIVIFIVMSVMLPMLQLNTLT